MNACRNDVTHVIRRSCLIKHEHFVQWAWKWVREREVLQMKHTMDWHSLCMEIPSNLVSVGYTTSKDCCNSDCFSLAPVCFPGSKLMKRTDTSLSSDSQFTSWPWSIYVRYRYYSNNKLICSWALIWPCELQHSKHSSSNSPQHPNLESANGPSNLFELHVSRLHV